MSWTLEKMVRRIGFDQVEETAKFMTIFGTVALYRARKPANKPNMLQDIATLESYHGIPQKPKTFFT